MSKPSTTDFLFSTWEPEEVAQLREILSKAPHLDIRAVTESRFLLSDVPLPHLKAHDGQLVIGLDRIRSYVETRAKMSKNGTRTTSESSKDASAGTKRPS